MYDFVVVGGGPAGSRFARQAAATGHDVILFEQGEIGEPLACSGHVSLDLWSFVPPEDHAQLFQHEIYGARFHVGGPQSRGYPFYRDTPVSNVIDRVALDQCLAGAAADAGATIATGHTVTGITEYSDHVAITVRSAGETRTVDTRMVAGCDGPVSRVRSALGLPEPVERLHGVLAFDPTPDTDPFVDVHLIIPGFFAWRIPRGDAGVEYGLAAAPGEAVKSRFSEYISAYGVEVENVCSGGIPIGPPDRVSTDRGFLIGDAAAQTKPFTGGGLVYGMTAADIAADVIDPRDPATVKTYEHAWRAELARDIQLGSLIRRAYDLPLPIKRIGLLATAGKIGVHMDRPTSLFSVAQLRAFLSRSQPEFNPVQ